MGSPPPFSTFRKSVGRIVSQNFNDKATIRQTITRNKKELPIELRMLQRNKVFQNTPAEMGAPCILPLQAVPPTGESSSFALLSESKQAYESYEEEVCQRVQRSWLFRIFLFVFLVAATCLAAKELPGVMETRSEMSEYNSYMTTLFEDIQAENSHLKSEMKALQNTIEKLQKEKSTPPKTDPAAEFELKLRYAQLKEDFARCDEARIL